MKYQKQWEVPSDNGDKIYKVSLTLEGTYKCSCPHWIFRLQKTGEDCKHIDDIKNGLYDQIPSLQFNLIRAAVKEVSLQDDRTTIYVPLIPIGDTDFFATIIYDLVTLGVTWDMIKEHFGYSFPKSWKRQAIVDHVKSHGRKVHREFIKGRGWMGFECKEAI